ncbi:MAG: hypothetical protein JO100_01695 [Pseudonocardia sp.]|nr:hypothetical protein [Pseudonocardia sp.]
MGMLASFLFGYWMGTRAGKEGLRKLRDAAVTVMQSDEFRTTAAGVAGMARGVMLQGMETVFGAEETTRPRAA